jgi:endo-1,4-beta-xylanase
VISPQNTSQFGATITIANNGTTALFSWTLSWTFANSQTVAELWNGIETQSGSTVTVTNESYNGAIAAGASYTGVGFNGTWNGTTNAVPTAISLNGSACTIN